MKILITGHKGFIGQHLHRELVMHGHEIAGVDIAASFPEQADLTEPCVAESVLEREEPEVVVHLAAQVGRVLGEDDVRHTIRSNAEMTTVLAQACDERGIRVLYASSSEVYGDQGDEILHEGDYCALPHNLYGLTKRWGEEALRLYCPIGLQIVRLSMPYGPGAPPGRGRRALDNILWQANTGQRIPIHIGAERSWCWIGDTVRGIRLVLERGEKRGTETRDDDYGVYNVGRDDVPISMTALAVNCCHLVGTDADLIDLIEPPAAQTVVKRLSTRKLAALGWTPTVELDEGLMIVLDWIKRFGPDGLPLPEREDDLPSVEETCLTPRDLDPGMYGPLQGDQ